MIKVETFPVGHLATNCYIVTDVATSRRAIVDPGYKNAELVKRIEKLGKETFDYILLTHGHFDHIWFAEGIKALTGAKIVISSEDALFLNDGMLNLSSAFGFRPFDFPETHADVTLKDGDTFELGETVFAFMSTPGHTVGSGCYISFSDNIIFSGDTLFKLSMGRTDFATGDAVKMLDSLKRLGRLQGDFEVFPGHGEPTTLESERKNNPYVSV